MARLVIAVADWLNESPTRQQKAKTVALGVTTGSYVLEMGFGNGSAVPDVMTFLDD